MPEPRGIDTPAGEEPAPDRDDRNHLTIRSDLRPGDIGAIVWMHGAIYAREYGFDHTFEAYVAGPLAEFALRCSPRERLWIAERRESVVGCVAVVTASTTTAQLRWFLVDPGARGLGLGRRLLKEAISFSEESGYSEIILWTVSALTAAAHLYRSAGFRKVRELPVRRWGVEVEEEEYSLEIGERGI
jgi:ribosomal protein S18 acetylase RimI-like enzyme